jgi:hypothetical protein
VPEGIQYDVADRPAGLPRQRACELCDFGIANMNLILHECSPPYDEARVRVHMYLGTEPARNLEIHCA